MIIRGIDKMSEKRIPIFGANWKAGAKGNNPKDNVDINELFVTRFLNEFVEDNVSIGSAISRMSDIEAFIAAPLIYIGNVRQYLNATNVALGAQDVYHEDRGAFTSKVTGPMLNDKGVKYILVGHSERRHLFGDTDQIVAEKAVAVYRNGMIPVLCVGEILAQRKSNQQKNIVKGQLDYTFEVLNSHVSTDDIAKLVVAYEPVWAIGTGETATPEQAQDMHSDIREIIKVRYGQDIAQGMRIQYGGSVKPGNILGIMMQPDIDGALIGGASLDPKSFFEIAKIGRDAHYGTRL